MLFPVLFDALQFGYFAGAGAAFSASGVLIALFGCLHSDISRHTVALALRRATMFNENCADINSR